MEIWKDIPGYEGRYQVSNIGRVKRLKRYTYYNDKKMMVTEKILSLADRDGYKAVALRSSIGRRTIQVHQLVAMAFLNHVRCGYKQVIDHINDNPSDNRVENLQVVTQRYNCVKSKKGIYTSKHTGVSWFKKYGKWRVTICLNGKMYFVCYSDNENDAHNAYKKALKDFYDKGLTPKDFKVKTSKYNGICFNKQSGKWLAYKTISGKQKYIGSFKSEYEAYSNLLNFKK